MIDVTRMLHARPVLVTDEAIAQKLWESKQRRTSERGRFDQDWMSPFADLDKKVVRDLVDDVRAVREALSQAPVTVIPEGWKLRNIQGRGFGDEFGKVYDCSLFCQMDPVRSDAVGRGPTWEVALQAAGEKAVRKP